MADTPRAERSDELLEEKRLTRRVGNAVGASFGQFPSETAPEVQEVLAEKPAADEEVVEVEENDLALRSDKNDPDK